MIRPVSTADEFWLTPEGSRASYLVGPLNYRERIAVDHDVMLRCGPAISDLDMGEEMRTAAGALDLPEDERAKVIAVVDAHAEAVQAVHAAQREFQKTAEQNGNLPDEVKQALGAWSKAATAINRVGVDLSRSWEPLRRKMADRLERNAEETLAWIARGVRDWRNVGRMVEGTWEPIACERERGKLTDAALMSIPDDRLSAIAEKVKELSKLTEADRGNSDSPSGVRVAPASPSAD